MTVKIVRRTAVSIKGLPEHLSPILQQIYANRGVKNSDELLLTAKQLLSADLMSGLDQACPLIFQALKNKHRIVIIGDFDADGATSTALMMEGLSELGSQNHQFLVPNRFEYGYGLSPEIVDVAHGLGAQLLITVDNGISCHQGVNRAKELGLDVVITDHHLPGKEPPNADAIVNPNQHGCSFPSKAIAGVGVAFYLMLALRKYCREQHWFDEIGLAEPNVAKLLDFVALGTVADVVPLDANNRILVAQGLKRIRAGHTRPGIQALIEIANRNQSRLVASDFGFALGPRINAAGRLDDMSYGINCLLASDISTARMMAQELDHLNKARREIEQGMQLEAERVLTKLNFTEHHLPSAIALFQADWHQGVIGIVAGRLKEKFNRPTIVFASASDDKTNQPSDEIKGSARSIIGLHIRDLLEHIHSQHPGIILKFGGHAMAAGLSIKAESFALFQQLFEQYAGEWLNEEDFQGVILSDGVLAIENITLSFAEQLREAGPWGQQFLEPVFDDQFMLLQQRLVGEKHLKIVVQKDEQVFDAIAFNIDINAWPNTRAKHVHLAYKLDVNEFRGKQTLQLMVEHLTLIK
jgi:single-stranded-DNA-specific exonuclease